jgi:trehalose-6-phosphatase
MARKKASKSRNPANVDITITDGNPPTVSPDPTTVSKSSEVAHWKTKPQGQDFLVVFEGNSPFDDWYFDRNRHTSKITVANPGPKSFKYTVFTASGAHKVDPGIIIKP